MAGRAASAQHKPLPRTPGDPMAPWRKPSDPPDYILPQILAARCLGITYGDPGPKLPASTCHECWGERYVWYGNCWGLSHRPGVPGQDGFFSCSHSCHDGEVLLAAAG
jgi:hypothetical protein